MIIVMVTCDQWSLLLLWLAEDSDHGEHFLAVKYFLIKEEKVRSQIINLTLQLKKLEKEEQTKLKFSRLDLI